MFWNTLRPELEGFALDKASPIIAAIAIHVLAYLIGRSLLRRPEIAKRDTLADHNLPMSFHYLFSKHFDILFQQIMVLTLVLLLQNAGLTTLGIIAFFIGIFATVHLGLFIHMERFFALYYTFFSIFASIIFPLLILRIPYGFAYSYAVHSLFYAATAILFRIYFLKREKKASIS